MQKKFFLIILSIIFTLSAISAQESQEDLDFKDIPEPPIVQELIDKLPKHLQMNVPPYYSPEFMILIQENLSEGDLRNFKDKFTSHIEEYFPGPPPIKFNAEILMELNRLSDIQISPDGGSFIFNVRQPNIRQNKLYSDIYSKELDGYLMKKVTRHAANDYNARWSPDGSKIAFISTRLGTPQIFTLKFGSNDLDGAAKITSMPQGVSNLLWSPDGKWLAFTSDVKIKKNLKDKYPDFPKADVKIYEDLPARHWDHWEDEYYSHLFIIPAEGGDAIDLMEDEPYDTPLSPFGGVEEIAWSPDSKQLAYTSKKVDDFENSTDSDIYLVDIDTKRTVNITDGMDGFDKAPNYSPDGRWIAFHSQERAAFESDRIRLMLFERSSGDIIELSEDLDQWVHESIWTPNSRKMYFSAEDGPVVMIYEIDLQGNYKTITDGRYNYGSGLAINPDGTKLYFGRQSMIEPLEFFEMDLATGKMEQLTRMNDPYMINVAKPQIRERWIESTDGAKVHTWIVLPPDFDSTKSYPMITYCQGGPQATISQRFHYRWNMLLMASKGYIVMAPNRRGLPGFGQEWNDAISRDWGGQPMQDILAATDALAEEDWVNDKQLSAVGASAGGYAVFWLAGNHDGRFKALISHCGVFDLFSMYGSTEELWFPNWEYGGPYWESDDLKEHYEFHSPHSYVENWDTPIMISTGEKDFRVPYTQSLEAFTAAQVKGVPSKLVYFPDETHFVAKPQEFIIWSEEFFNWLDKYTKF